MIAELTPYSLYKDSSSFLGAVPHHWAVLPLAGVARPKSIINQAKRELLSVYLHRGVVRFVEVDEKRTNATSAELSKYQAVDPGDFVLNNQQAWRGSVGVSAHAGIVSPAYLVLELSERLLSDYANLLLRDQSMVAQYLTCSKGVGTIQRNLYWPHLKRVGVIVPPRDEQAAIVRFLGWANKRIVGAARSKQRVITLLNEQRQSIIQRAVTRGLEVRTAMKATDLAWLPEIPAHWEVIRAKHILREVNSRSEHGDEVLLRVSQYSGVTPRGATDGTGMPRAESLVGYKRTRAGNLVVNIMIAWNGSLGVSNHDGIVSPAYCVFEFVGVHNPWFYHHLLRTRAYGARIKQESTGVIDSRLRLYPDAFGRIPLLVPPREEQDAIVRSVEAETKGISLAVSRLEREIALLAEYRTRLVSDVVTGKLDVRIAVASLPGGTSSELTSDTELGGEGEGEGEGDGVEAA